ncbi:hypothetical protein IGI04_038568 [Brassica rapa subsp. trilocularis]|uniref:Prephenate/arogenate dehydrogenase domain-containing protein n=1 Tax=Brassica rapa subsp. trilocularis TaxID=1813537 RepID=A0ABQ7LKJ5_BRACM|nr:hypothetical protein IGI04_038568 [Brassica rapa subsp. trilocularis]
MLLHFSPTKPLFSPPNLRRNPPISPPRSLRIRAIDAAQIFDYETQLKSEYRKSSALKIAVLGFGNFGQFLSKTLIRHGHDLITHSRSDYSSAASSIGARFFHNPHDLCEQHPDVVLLCTSILSTESVLRSFPFQRLRRSTLFVDVLSVKEFPKTLFLKYLPKEFDILCTHPMFGPESGKHSWSGLPFVYDKVRIGDESSRHERCDKFLKVFESEGCRMVEMSCEEHDKHAAGSQFVTHTMGRVLEKFGNALEQLERLDMAFESIKKELFGRLHQVYRKQMFGGGGEGKKTEQKLLNDGVVRVKEESSSSSSS